MKFSYGKIEYALLGLLLVSTALIYWKTLGYGFYYDDYKMLENPYLYYSSNFGKAFQHQANRPIGLLIWFAISYVWGLQPVPFHALAIILHLLCGMAFYFMLKALIGVEAQGTGMLAEKSENPLLGIRKPASGTQYLTPGPRIIAPLVITLIFLLHPIQTESVVYSVQAMSILPMALSCFLTVICYINYRAGAGKIYLFAVFFLIFVASTSRESSIVLPVSLWLVEWLFISKCNIKESLRRLPILIGSLIFSATIIAICVSLQFYFFKQEDIIYTGISPVSYLITQFVVIMRYIRLIFVFVGQNMSHDFPIYHTLFSLNSAFSLLSLCAILAAALYFIKKNPMFTFGIFWFFLYLVPTSSIVSRPYVMSEHRLFMPLAGLAISFTAIIGKRTLYEHANHWSIRWVATLFFLFLVMGVSTSLRLNVWENNITLWTDVIKKSPNLPGPYNNLGIALEKQGKVDEAIANYSEALEINPEYVNARNNLGLLLSKKGEIDEAIAHYVKALNIEPNDADVHNNLGLALFRKGKTEEAIAHYSDALKIKPYLLVTHKNIGIALQKQGKIDKAIAHYYQALRTNQNDEITHNNLGYALTQKKEFEEALKHYYKALKIKPDYAEVHHKIGIVLLKQGDVDLAIDHFGEALKKNPDLTEAHYNLGTVMDKRGETAMAIRHYNETLRLRPDHVEAHNNLGIVLGKQGKIDEAISHFSKALKIKPDDSITRNNLEFALKKKAIQNRQRQ